MKYVNMPELTYPPNALSKVRNSRRAHYDRATVHGILDAAPVAHVGFITEGRPIVIPMIFARCDDTLYIHGAKATRVIRSHADGAPACLTVTLVDGIVVARSAFHHSMNYRSVVAHGVLRPITDAEEKKTALIAITNHLLPDRWSEVRPMNTKELNATGVLAFDIETASAKSRNGPPVDAAEDYELPIWAGVLPITLSVGQPVHDGRLADGTRLPASIARSREKFSTGLGPVNTDSSFSVS